MSTKSGIEWTEATWNPTTGCDRISAGCDNCYALTLAKRLKAMGSAKYQTDGDPRTSGPGFGVAIHADALTQPLHWREPRTVFVNSMSDLFHARVPAAFVEQVWDVMAETPRHTYQILTKRPHRMALVVNRMPNSHWPLRNVWLGTSVESDEHVGRVDDLRRTSAKIRFVSAEPLLGPLPSLDLTDIDWLIVGGESGGGSRPMDLAWVYDLIALARESGTAVFVKQLGKMWAGSGKGGDWSRWPSDLRIREYPPQSHPAVGSAS
jgi:protein gp37